MHLHQNLSSEKGTLKLKDTVTSRICMHLGQSNPILHTRYQATLGCSNDSLQG